MPLERGSLRRSAAAVLAEAFLDDPVWVAIGPRVTALRRRVLRSFFGLALMEALHHGGPSWCAVRGGRVVGAAVTFGDGTRFPPPRSGLIESPPFILAGPGPAIRGMRVATVMERAHPRDPHLYLWFLGAHPSAQRAGVGRALMRHVLAECDEGDRPAYLETTRPENVPYYRSFGFSVAGEEALPPGGRMWFMARGDLDMGHLTGSAARG